MQKPAHGHLIDALCRHLVAAMILIAATIFLQADAAPPIRERAAPWPNVADAEFELDRLLCGALRGGVRKVQGVPPPAAVEELADVTSCTASFFGAPPALDHDVSGAFRWEADGTTAEGAQRTVRGEGFAEVVLTPQGARFGALRWQVREAVERAQPRFARVVPPLPGAFQASTRASKTDPLLFAAAVIREGGALAALDLDGDGLPELLAARGRKLLLLQNRGALRFEPRLLKGDPAPGGLYVAALPLAGPAVALVSSAEKGPSRVELRTGVLLDPGVVLDLPDAVTAAAAEGDRLYLAGPAGIALVTVTNGTPLLRSRARLALSATDALLADALGLGHAQLILAGEQGVLAWDPAQPGAAPRRLAPGSFVSADAGDVRGDGRLSVLAAGFAEPEGRALALGLGREALPRTTGQATLVHQGALEPLSAVEGFAFGGVLADLDGDGRLDAFFATGLASAGRSLLLEEQYLRERAALPRSHEPRTADLFGQAQKRLLLRRAGGSQEAAFAEGLDDDGDGRSVLTLDLDGDGRPDLVVLERDHPALVIFHNQGPAQTLWLDLATPGEAEVLDAPAGQARRFAPGTGRGFHAASLGPLQIPLGARPGAQVQVRWASGAVQPLGELPAGRFQVREGEAPRRVSQKPSGPAPVRRRLTAAALRLPLGRPGVALVGARGCPACRDAAEKLPSFREGDKAVVVTADPDPAAVALELGLHEAVPMTPELESAFARPLNPGAVLVFRRDGTLRRVLREPERLDAYLDEERAATAQLDRRR